MSIIFEERFWILRITREKYAPERGTGRLIGNTVFAKLLQRLTLQTLDLLHVSKTALTEVGQRRWTGWNV
jgi:hypothetical protein